MLQQFRKPARRRKQLQWTKKIALFLVTVRAKVGASLVPSLVGAITPCTDTIRAGSTARSSSWTQRLTETQKFERNIDRYNIGSRDDDVSRMFGGNDAGPSSEAHKVERPLPIPYPRDATTRPSGFIRR